MRKIPMLIFTILYIFSIIFFAYAVRICERPLYRFDDMYYTYEGNYPD